MQVKRIECWSLIWFYWTIISKIYFSRLYL